MGKKVEWIAPVLVIMVSVVFISCSSKVTETPSLPEMTSTPTSIPPSPTPTRNPRPTPTNVPDVEGTVQVWLDWTSDQLQVLTPHLNTFREKFPFVQIEISYYTPDEILESYRQGFLDGNAPDILIGESQWGEELYLQGMIRDISDRIPPEMIELIYPVAWESVQDSGVIYGLPLSMEGIVLYRNPEIVQTPVETLELMAEMLPDLEAEDKTGTVVDLGFLYTGAFISTCDGQLADHEGHLLLTHTALECWLRLLKTFGETGSGTQNSDFDLNLFLNEKSAWLIEGSWMAEDLLLNFGEHGIAIDPWPQFADVGKDLSGYSWTQNIYFNSSLTKQEFDPAWVFARYLLTEEVQLSAVQTEKGRRFPVLRDLDFEDQWLQQMMTAMEGNIALPRDPIFRFFSLELEPAAFDVVRRKYDAYWLTQWAMSNIERAILFRGGAIH